MTPSANRGVPGAALGYGFGGYWGDFAPVAPVQPVINTIVFQAPEPVQPPAPPIHSSIQEVRLPPSEPAAGGPQALFVIALRNGTRVEAAAVWVQGNELHYVDGDNQTRRVALESVDRATTRELNQAKNLNLRLPAPR